MNHNIKKQLYTVILAAGKGTRMKSDLPKVLHKINEKELVKYVIDQATDTGSDETYIVVGYKRELVENAVANYSKNLYFVEQREQLGTGHAVMMAEEALKYGEEKIDSISTSKELVSKINKFIKSNEPKVEIDYIVLRESETLDEIKVLSNIKNITLLLAVKVGETRLIDNKTIKGIN